MCLLLTFVSITAPTVTIIQKLIDPLTNIIPLLPLKFQLMTLRRVCVDLNKLSQSMHVITMRSISEFEHFALNDSIRTQFLSKSDLQEMQQMYHKLIKIPLFTLRFPSFLKKVQLAVIFQQIAFRNFQELGQIWCLIPFRFGFNPDQVIPKKETYFLASTSQMISLHLMTGGST